MEGTTAAERATMSVGTSLAATLITALWLVGGIILGLFVLFTRPKS